MFWTKASTQEIRAEGLAELVEQGQPPVIIDVRSQDDYTAKHLPGAINIPLRELEERVGELDPAALTVFY